MTIIFYDIPSKLPGVFWSPNTSKTRFYLDYRRIPYKTEWLEYPDIEAFSKKHSIPPTTIYPASQGLDPVYTLPAIHDPSTGVYLAESLEIALYLDEKYPESVTGVPRVIPEGTLGLQKAFYAAFWKILEPHLLDFLLITAPNLNPVSEEFFRRTKAERAGLTSLEDAIPSVEVAKARWAQLETEFGKAAKWYPSKEKGIFIMGTKPVWADIAVAAILHWMKSVYGAESDKWNDIARWDDGRWKELLESVQSFTAASAWQVSRV
ncbi:hypothetical protein CPB83DRAFT_891877 [Crepidotus variabilis]|uniref:GST N-terminal domain-containing protein n=1 Tax=Crepidotus variabilis TaxID=179855 RepID=A0A9P6JS34_9AGAR|nr:hypothetical protein CPB83DRAFT_891877 [Crepidotus variabilis]